MFHDLLVEDSKREKLYCAVQLTAPSGAGKTTGALLIAYGLMKSKYPELDDEMLWKKIGLIDTEHRRSQLYVGLHIGGITIGSFKVIHLNKPFSVERYVYCGRALKQQGVEVLVVDSASHAWEGEGGILDYNGTRFQNWNDTNKEVYNPLVQFLTGEGLEMHTISTARTKQEYAMVPDELGKIEVKKLGLKPVQRDSLEYEMQIVFRIDMDHNAVAVKDNSGVFYSMGPKKIGPEHGEILYKWLEAGEDIHAEKRAEEEERLFLIQEIEGLVIEYGLKAWQNQMEAHPSVGPLKDAHISVVRKFRQALQTQMEAKEKAQKEKEEQVAEK